MGTDARLDVGFDMNLMFRERWKEGVYGNLLDSMTTEWTEDDILIERQLT